MSAVASLARPSPSSTTTSRRGTPSRRTMESGATTSGGDTMAPSTNPTASGMPSSDARRVDQRRQDPEQNQFGSELHPRQAGNQREGYAGDDEKDRGSGVGPPCHNGHDDKYRDQQQKRLDRRR